MRTTISTATVMRRGVADPVLVPVQVVSFDEQADPVSLADQERELRIQAEGLLLQAEMLSWERTKDSNARVEAGLHLTHMEGLIAGRSEVMRARLEQQRGLV